MYGYVTPKCDSSEPDIVMSIMQRVGREFPPSHKPTLESFYRFVSRWVHRNVEPLPSTTDTSFETWIEGCSYPLKRKNELRRVRAELPSLINEELPKKFWVANSFIKDEDFVVFKAARAICSRTDEAKVVFGPYVKLFDKDLFARPQFIKTVPVRDRPDYILNHLGSEGPYHIADYSAFESLFTPDMIKNVELCYMKRLFANMPNGHYMIRLMEKVMAGTNYLKFRNVFVKLFGRRLSGEMSTSSGNGFTNSMFLEYIAHSYGGTVKYVCEGDDSASKFIGCSPVDEDFEKLGVRVKLEQVSDICRASFCGNVFDDEDRVNVTDPLQYLAAFSWSNRRYVHSSVRTRRTLLRAKALSAAYQYPGCPVIQAHAHRILELTSGYDTRRVRNNMSLWEMEQFDQAMKFKYSELYKPIGANTRQLVYEVYGIDVQTQLDIENVVKNMTFESWLPPSNLTQLLNPCWARNWDSYVMVSKDDHYLNQHKFNTDWLQRSGLADKPP
jgi:hypothetical protein